MARGTYRPDSDIDLCVEGLPGKNFFRALAECLMASHRSLSIVDLDLSIELHTGKFSHRDTLRQFDNLLNERDITDFQETGAIITNLMAFRHVATKLCDFLIDANKLSKVVEDINTQHKKIEKLFHELLETL